MRFVMFYHSLLSDWNHGNAHFLRGIVTELTSRGHDVRVYEPRDGWSLNNLLAEHGPQAVERFRQAYPGLRSEFYDPPIADMGKLLHDADVVLVHEWNPPEFIRRVGEHRAAGGRYHLLFHDTHHRLVSDRDAIGACGLENYDGVLAFGEVLRRRYLDEKLARQAWTWHEAADTRIFSPAGTQAFEGDLVWIGNWGDEERTEELREFLLEPVRRLGLRARVYGVRYPREALDALDAAGIEYGGWLANFDVPMVYSRYRTTVHVPRRPYVRMLPGIPTIRVFEALACGIPLVSSPWEDREKLFEVGEDFLMAASGAEMTDQLEQLLRDERAARRLAARGRRTIVERHTCDHRVDELLAIVRQLDRAEVTGRTQR
jgi:spore maturation protein CgeB